MEKPQTMRVLSYIKSEVRAGNPVPGQTQIAKYMGWKFGGSVTDVMTRLVVLGYLKRSPAQAGSKRRWSYEIIN
jgi:DNA-binding MarR family transcriptional regulator